MRRIALDLGRTTVLDGNQHSAGIRAIVRTGGVNDLLHDFLIISCLALLNQLAQKKLLCSLQRLLRVLCGRSQRSLRLKVLAERVFQQSDANTT